VLVVVARVPTTAADARQDGAALHYVRGDSLDEADWDAGRSDTQTNTPMRVRLTPSPARLGQPLMYRGVVLTQAHRRVRFEPPRSGGAFTWSQVRAGRVKPNNILYGQVLDSIWIEARLQVFETGPVTVPGLVVQMDPAPHSRHAGSSRLPNVHVVILPTITAADSDAQLRPLHGPLAAPWWERVAWAPVVLVLLLLVVAGLIVRALRRRRPKPVVRAAAVPAAPAPRLDPAAAALRALAALRARELPVAGRFGEHALELTAILRRFLESTLGTPRPGDTSGEVLERLRAARMPSEDYTRLEGLLGLWDRVKFARAPLTDHEAVRCEEAVESYVRAVAQARLDALAAAARAAAARAAASGAPGGPGGPVPPAPHNAPEAA
jgi:hypothetical protein